MFIKTKNEFGKVLDTVISEHQRDLTNSSVMRDFPIILVNLTQQINTLLKPGGKDKSPFILRIKVNEEKLDENMKKSIHLIMAEPIYISLQLAGYQGDAHHLVNHTLTPLAQKDGQSIMAHLMKEAETDIDLQNAVNNIPDDIMYLLWRPNDYTGKAALKANEVAKWAREQIV
jgi:adenylosuccinate lyase